MFDVSHLTSGGVLCRYKLRSKVVSEDVTPDFSVWVRWGDPPEVPQEAKHLSGMAGPPPPSTNLQTRKVKVKLPVGVHHTYEQELQQPMYGVVGILV